MKKSYRPARKSPKKSSRSPKKAPKYYKYYKKSNKKVRRTSGKKHKIIKLAEPIRHDVKKIVKNSGFSLIKTALITAAVAALISAGANKYNINSITKMVAPYVDNISPQIDIHGIINNTLQYFPAINVDKFHDILSNVNSADISSIASKNIKESIEDVESFEKPTIRDFFYKTIKIDPNDIVYVVIPAHFNKNKEYIQKKLIPIEKYMKNEQLYWEDFEENSKETLNPNPEIVITGRGGEVTHMDTSTMKPFQSRFIEATPFSRYSRNEYSQY